MKVYIDKDTLDEVRVGFDSCNYIHGYFNHFENKKMISLTHEYTMNQKFFDLVTDPAEADILSIPNGYFRLHKHPLGLEVIQHYQNLSKRYRKPLLINAFGDLDDEIPIENSINLWFQKYRPTISEFDIIVPPSIIDIGSQGTNIRVKSKAPKVGFMGFAEYDSWLIELKQRLLNSRYVVKHFFDGYSKAKIDGKIYRKLSIRNLEKSPGIESAIVVRPFFGGSKTIIESNFNDVRDIREEYINNLIESDYVLTPKGAGNFSLRFYETLSVGRIPILINTEMVLPLEDMIDYSEFCLIINYQDISKLGDILTDFHKNLSNEKFQSMQAKSREAFIKYLRVDNFYRNLFSTILPQKIATLPFRW